MCFRREEREGRREEGRGKREEGRGKREEGRGKREEGRGKREGKRRGGEKSYRIIYGLRNFIGLRNRKFLFHVAFRPSPRNFFEKFEQSRSFGIPHIFQSKKN
jgi:hypothetical protein